MKIWALLLILFTLIPCDSLEAEEIALTLDEAVAIALRDNRDILLKTEDVQKAKAEVAESQSSLLPSLDFTATQTNTRGYYPKDLNQTTTQTTVKQYLYKGGKTINTIQYNEFGLTVAEAILDKTKLETALTVKKTFYTLLLATEFADLNKGEILAYIDRDEVGLKFENAPVESPLSGIIGRVYVDIGQNVNMQTPIALVVDIEKVKIGLDIPEKYIPKVSLGQQAKIMVDAYPQEVFSGKVTKISPVVNLENRAAPIEITLDNQGERLKSGMFAKVYLIIEQRPSVPVILKEAILGKQPDTYLYLIENNKAVTKKITLGIHSGPYYEVLEGIKAGNLVVIVGQQRLYDNAPVVVEMDNSNAGGLAQ